MKRRDFTRGLVSLGLAPAAPLSALSAGGAGTAAAAGMADKMYFVSWYTARLNPTCSARMLASELKMDGQVARDIFARLVRDNTVSAPNALGVSKTLQPLGEVYAKVTGASATKSAAQSVSQKPYSRSSGPVFEDVQPEPLDPVEMDVADADTLEIELSADEIDADDEDNTQVALPENPETSS